MNFFLINKFISQGGPLMMEVDQHWVQLGIVSFGNKCGEPSYPGVMTLYYHLNYISKEFYFQLIFMAIFKFQMRIENHFSFEAA